MDLSKLILKAGYTPQMLADAIGVSRNAIYSYISGSSYPRAENLMAICKTLGYSEKTVLDAITDAKKEVDSNVRLQQMQRTNRRNRNLHRNARCGGNE